MQNAMYDLVTTDTHFKHNVIHNLSAPTNNFSNNSRISIQLSKMWTIFIQLMNHFEMCSINVPADNILQFLIGF